VAEAAVAATTAASAVAAPRRTRVLYIAGTGRSGSTLLAAILGEVEGVFTAGELRFLWERSLLEDRLCGCGLHFGACTLWEGVLETAFGGRAGIDARHELREQRRRTRIRHLPRLLVAGDGRGVAANDAHGEHGERLERLYARVAEATGAGVVVDSSKLPSYARLLDTLPGVDVHVVHLVRDPRAAARSWMRQKPQPDRGWLAPMQTIGPLKSASLWVLWNATAELLWRGRPDRYLRVRYEDLMERPQETVGRILAMVGMAGAATPFVDERTVTLGVNHTVAGNPDRLRHGLTRLRADGGGPDDLRTRDRLLVTALAAPLLLRYGYAMRRPAAAGRDRAEDGWVNVQHLPHLRRLAHRVERHWRWGRTQGFRRLIEEDQLDPIARLRAGAMRRRWVRGHAVPPGSAVPVYLVGLQRSGTNMVVRSLEASAEFEVHNENDARAFDRFLLRPEPVIRSLVETSPHRFVLFKPLCDSHRVDALLDGLGTASAGRAIWVFRSVDGRTRSALAKFGDHSLHVLREIAEGRGDGLWQAQRMSAGSLALIRDRDLGTTSPETAAALLWYARNLIYFEAGLDARDDVMPVSYDAFVRAPDDHLRAMRTFLGSQSSDLPRGPIRPRGGPSPAPLDLDPTVRALCDTLDRRLAATAAATLRCFDG
jgi:hypothetical protein